MELSKRLRAVADLVSPGLIIADVGTDHAYVPIQLVEEGRIPSAIAMDINEGPLLRAEKHIREHGLEHKIETRRSSGLKELKVQEAQSMIAAGMGGALIIQILSDCPEIVISLKECILQPQSEIGKVRKFLIAHACAIVEENMVYEDGKFYPMMRVDAGEKRKKCPIRGRVQVRTYPSQGKNHPVLLEFLKREIQQKGRILDSLTKRADLGGGGKTRIRELTEEKESLERAAARYH